MDLGASCIDDPTFRSMTFSRLPPSLVSQPLFFFSKRNFGPNVSFNQVLKKLVVRQRLCLQKF
jgi:hypothetical protein